MDALSLIIMSGVIMVAATIRGYSGFGFSLTAIIPLSMLMTPARAVPLILLMEIAASLRHLPMVWRQVDWKSLRWLYIGALIGTPLGVRLLVHVPPRPMQAAIAVVVLCLALLLWRNTAPVNILGRSQTAMVGLGSGMLNGGGAVGGPPVILFFLASPREESVSRASMIAFFLGLDLVAIAFGVADGLVTRHTWFMAAIGLLPLLAGIGLGHRMFGVSDPAAFRSKLLVLLMLLAVAALARAAAGI